MEAVHIIHADRCPLFRLGMRTALSPHVDLQVVAEAEGLRFAQELLEHYRPALFIAQVDSPDLGDCERTIRAIKLLRSRTRVILVARSHTRGTARRAEELGVDGFVARENPVPTLVSAVRRVADGERVFDDVRTDGDGRLAPDETALRRAGTLLQASLTERELEVARMLALGMSVKEIAGSLHRSGKTIESHKTHLMSKLGLHDRVHLSRLAVREGWIEA